MRKPGRVLALVLMAVMLCGQYLTAWADEGALGAIQLTNSAQTINNMTSAPSINDIYLLGGPDNKDSFSPSHPYWVRITDTSEKQVYVTSQIQSDSNGRFFCCLGSFAALGSGHYKVSVYSNDTDWANNNRRSQTFQITGGTPSDTLTASANNIVQIYDGTAYGITVTPNLDGTTIMYGSSAGTYDSAVSPTQTNVGVLTVYYQVTKPGYTAVTGSATVTIQPRPVTLTADDKSKVFGALDPDLTATMTSGTMVSGETLSYSVSRAPGEAVGPYAITVTPGINSNYSVTTNPGTFTITLADTLTASAPNIVQTYDGTAYGIVVTPGLAGSTIMYGSGAGTYNLATSPTQTSVGTLTVYYQVTKPGYAAVTGSATVTIQPRPVTLTADDKSKVFGASDPNLTATMTSGTMVSGETLSYSVSRAPGEAVGPYAITVTPGINSNYTVTTNPGTFTIVAASPMTASAPNVHQTYDGIAYGIVVTPDTDGATIAYGLTAGTYDLAASPTQTNVGVLTVYYQVTKAGFTTVTGSATVTIDPRPVTLTADDKNKVQGVQDPALTATLTSGTVVSGETLNYTIGREPGEDAGTYEITISESLNPNYLVTTIPGTFTITLSSTLTASASSIVQTYDGTAYGITVSPNLAGTTTMYGLTAGAYNLPQSPTQTNVGVLTVYYQVTKQGYAPVSGSATVTINPRPVTLTADNRGKVRGSADPALTATLTSGTVVSGETLSYLVNRIPGESVGTYPITIVSGNNPNYVVTTIPGIFTISEPYTPPPVVNHAPLAVDDTSSSVAGVPVTIAVLTNDSDPDGDPITVTGNTSPANGTAVLANNQITYTPAAGFVGTDTFTYTITDGQGHTATATVTIDVTDIDEPIPGGETVLPKAGGINPLVYCGAGLALAGVGLVLRKRK